MSDEGEEVHGSDDPTEFKIGFDASDPEVMIIQVPIRAWAMDENHGTALFHGHMREAEAIGMRTIVDIRRRKVTGRIITPGGNGSLGIH